MDHSLLMCMLNSAAQFDEQLDALPHGHEATIAKRCKPLAIDELHGEIWTRR